MMSEILRILLLEDSPTDAELNERELRKAGIEFNSLRVDTRDTFIRALEEFRPDVILSDYKLPDFDGMAALKIVRRDHPEVPVIMVTGALSDIEAVELIHAGARDYVLKDRLARLAIAVQLALSVEQGIRSRKMAEEKFRKISESAQDAIIMLGSDQRISFWNAAAARIFGYTAVEAMGQELHTLITPAAAQAKFSQAFPHFQETGDGPIIGKVRELTALRKGGEEFPVELSVSATQFGDQWHAIGIVRDITGRKQAEATFHTLVAILAQNIGAEFFHRTVSSLCTWLGVECVIVGELMDEGMVRALAMQLDGKAVEHYEYLLAGTPCESATQKGYCEYHEGVVQLFPVDKDLVAIGAEAYVGTPVRDKNGKVNGILCAISRHKFIPPPMVKEMFEIIAVRAGAEIERKLAEAKILSTQAELQGLLDAANQSRRAMLSVIEDQKRAEVAILHANRALATLGAVNRSLVYATSEDELLQAICQAIVEQRGYRSAWVGYVQHDAEKTIRPMAQSGFAAGYLDTLPLTWADSEYGQSPTGRAVRSGVAQIAQNILLDPSYAAWREQALKQGFAASIALPLRNGSGVFGNLSIYAAEANAFDQVEIALLEEMAGDLAFGVNALRIRHERDNALAQNQQHLAQMQDSLEDTVRAIASIVEMRDPYTAGHQVRVADLAAAIATHMELPAEQVHAIHLAGVVHDLGKMQIPAEILSKPGKITDIEFSLIKVHPQAGYDILKGINFPWPIAQMVLQHHERLDGSGYPQGLKGDAILLEARILSVADVVEAMYSHRPYRPGLGMEVALAEITRQRGIYFDPVVADACLALFREQHYTFKS